MELYQSKSKYALRMSIIFIFIVLVQCARPNLIIAEEGTVIIEKAAPISKTAVIRSEIQTLDQNALKELQKPEVVEIPEQPVPEAAPKIVVKAQTFKMPTAENLSQEMKNIWGAKVTGTDQWNELIYKVSKEEQIDPIFVKCVMVVESGGYQQAHNTKNANGTQDYGLMQVNTSWGNYFDYNRMLNDPEYAIRSGIKVIKAKIAACDKAGIEPTVYEVLWRYNGKTQRGKQYADRVSRLYAEMAGKSTQETVKKNVTEKNA